MDGILNFVLGVVVIVVGLAVSIGLHEVGHLLPAKRFGVKVPQYMIGFGPTLFSWRRGETEYGIKAIPLGGYISMIGMYPPGPNAENSTTDGFFRRMIQDARTANGEGIEPGDENRVFFKLPVRKRLVIMLGGPLMNLLLATALFAVLLSGIGLAKPGTSVATVAECVVPAGSSQTECAASDPLSPAAAAGIQPGDQLETLNGIKITDWSVFSQLVADSPGVPLRLVVTREINGVPERVTMQLTPQLSERFVLDERGQILEENGEPVTEARGFVGIGPATELQPQPLSELGPFMLDSVGSVFTALIALPQNLFGVAESTITGTERDPNGPLSVVGIGRVAGEIAANEDVPVLSKAAGLLGMIASLNLFLFAFNLIPLLPLDGGHIAASLWEAIRRRFAKWFGRPDPGPVDAAKLVPLTFVVVVAMLGMTALLVVADIVNPIRLFG